MFDNIKTGNLVKPKGELSVVAHHVTARYMTPSAKASKSDTSLVKRVVTKAVGRKVRVPLYPVKDVTFTAYNGDAIGFIGVNGAGKSTLLRIVAGLERPLEGQIYTSSTPSLLGVNAAMLLHLDAYANARLGCLAMGLTLEETAEAVPKIIEFAELKKVAHRPVRTYSSGMHQRLRFAISTIVRADILIVDEALGAGDATFTAKAHKAIDGLLDNAGTLLTVSHAMTTIRSMCNRVIWLHEGRIIADGEVKEITSLYAQWTKCVSGGDKKSAQSLISDVQESYIPLELDVDHTPTLQSPKHFSQ